MFLIWVRDEMIAGSEDRIMHLWQNMRGLSYLEEAKNHLNHALKRAYIEGLYVGRAEAKGGK